jgi:hypothetical protein
VSNKHEVPMSTGTAQRYLRNYIATGNDNTHITAALRTVVLLHAKVAALEGKKVGEHG